MDPGSRRTRLLAVLPVVVALFAGAHVAFAQVERVGSTFQVIVGPTVFGDPAYDPIHDVYLVVEARGLGAIKGQFVAPTGALIGGPFTIAGLADYYDGVRVTYGAGGFLVSWIGGYPTYGNEAKVRARMVAYGSGGVPQFLTDQVLVSDGPAKSNLPVAASYSTVSGNFLVAFVKYGPGYFNVRARQVWPTGVIGPEIAVTANVGQYDEYVSVGYNPNADEFLLAFRSWSDAEASGQMIVRRVSAATSEVAPQRISFDGPTVDTYGPSSVLFDPASNRYVGYWRGSRTPAAFGRWINPDGTVGGRDRG